MKSLNVIENDGGRGPTNPLDLDPSAFEAGLDRRQTNRQAMIAWITRVMVDGSDFGSIPTRRGPSKKSLWKPGAEKICGMLGCSVRFPNLGDYEQAAISGTALEQIVLRAEILDPSGNIVAEGIGARSLKQDQGDLNKALKMAEKSAHIDATLRLAGLSELFTQDLEDMQGLAAEPEEEKATPGQIARYWELIQIQDHNKFYTFIHSLSNEQRIDVANNIPAGMKKMEGRAKSRDFENETENLVRGYAGMLNEFAMSDDQAGLAQVKDLMGPDVWKVVQKWVSSETALWLKYLAKARKEEERSLKGVKK